MIEAYEIIYLQNFYDQEATTWCGDQINDDDIEYILKAKYDALRAEIERLKARIEEMQAEVEESNSLLRSAFQIAKRDGKDTNWEAWRKQLDIALVRQHKLMYGEESEEE